ncbi:hypothetical protein HUU42_12500 [bacterium]|nr:hypothetical protein [bacterium]
MRYFPVRIIDSHLYLNRKDYSNLFGETKNLYGENVVIQNGSSAITIDKITVADQNLLELTPADAQRLRIDGSTIITPKDLGFLNLTLKLVFRNKEINFSGKLQLIPRTLFVNGEELKSLGLDFSTTVFVAVNTARPTIFGDVRLVSTLEKGFFILSKEEAAGALLKENDSVYVVSAAAAKTAELSPSIAEKLPSRFLEIDLTLKGNNQFVLITEAHVWKAIQAKKKIWVPKNARLTPAAKDLGSSRKIFEFE